MEEDIKILEEICNRPIQDTEGTKRMKQALENLLARYKDLEQIEQSHKKENGELRERVKELEKENKNLKYKYKTNGRVLFTPEAIAEKHIPKTKVKEMIEKLKEMNLDCDTFGSMRDYAVLILKELLKE